MLNRLKTAGAVLGVAGTIWGGAVTFGRTEVTVVRESLREHVANAEKATQMQDERLERLEKASGNAAEAAWQSRQTRETLEQALRNGQIRPSRGGR